jgi:hypothetical protein
MLHLVDPDHFAERVERFVTAIADWNGRAYAPI